MSHRWNALLLFCDYSITQFILKSFYSPTATSSRTSHTSRLWSVIVFSVLGLMFMCAGRTWQPASSGWSGRLEQPVQWSNKGSRWRWWTAPSKFQRQVPCSAWETSTTGLSLTFNCYATKNDKKHTVSESRLTLMPCAVLMRNGSSQND